MNFTAYTDLSTVYRARSARRHCRPAENTVIRIQRSIMRVINQIYCNLCSRYRFRGYCDSRWFISLSFSSIFKNAIRLIVFYTGLITVFSILSMEGDMVMNWTRRHCKIWWVRKIFVFFSTLSELMVNLCKTSVFDRWNIIFHYNFQSIMNVLIHYHIFYHPKKTLNFRTNIHQNLCLSTLKAPYVTKWVELIDFIWIYKLKDIFNCGILSS